MISTSSLPWALRMALMSRTSCAQRVKEAAMKSMSCVRPNSMSSRSLSENELHVELDARNIDGLAVGERAAVERLADDVGAVDDLEHLERDQTVVDEDAGARLNVVRQTFVGDGDDSVVALDVAGGQGELLALDDLDLAVLVGLGADLRALGVEHDADRHAELLAGSLYRVHARLVLLVGAVAEVHTGNVHARLDHFGQDTVGRRTEGADNFSFAHQSYSSLYQITNETCITLYQTYFSTFRAVWQSSAKTADCFRAFRQKANAACRRIGQDRIISCRKKVKCTVSVPCAAAAASLLYFTRPYDIIKVSERNTVQRRTTRKRRFERKKKHMNKPVLVIMAAGMGSRYGGLKQIDPIGPERSDHSGLLGLRRPPRRLRARGVHHPPRAARGVRAGHRRKGAPLHAGRLRLPDARPSAGGPEGARGTRKAARHRARGLVREGADRGMPDRGHQRGRFLRRGRLPQDVRLSVAGGGRR